MSRAQCDVDIDFPDREVLLSKIIHTTASRIEKGTFKKHNTGVYLQSIPVNPLTGLCTIDYETAEKRGYFKIDFLNVNAYQGIKNETHINKLLAVDPLWELLYEQAVCDQLIHINGYHALLAKLTPRSISELAIVLALIRPGKKHLLIKCVEEGFKSIETEIWTKSDTGYTFKKSHGIAYSHLIIMQLNLICEQLSGHS